jgi:hypothetical protein
MMKLNLFCCFLRRSLFDLPAVPVNRFRVERPALNCHGFPFVTKHFAGQAGILRFAFELLRTAYFFIQRG